MVCSKCGAETLDGFSTCVVCESVDIGTTDRRGRGNLDGRYEILREIGRSGFSVLYRALDIAGRKEVVVKTVTVEHGLPADSIEDIVRDLQGAVLLKHPGIVGTLDVKAVEKTGAHIIYIVSELVDGESLGIRLRHSGAYQIRESIHILKQLAAALDYAHSEGMIHGDLKPANILFTCTGKIQVSDFGLMQALRKVSPSSDPSLIHGSIGYMSPEQIEGRDKPSKSWDIYSLATIAHEMLVGRAPFIGMGVSELLEEKLDRPIPSMRDRRPYIPEGMDEVLSRALSPDPSSRPSSAGELVELLARHGMMSGSLGIESASAGVEISSLFGSGTAGLLEQSLSTQIGPTERIRFEPMALSTERAPIMDDRRVDDAARAETRTVKPETVETPETVPTETTEPERPKTPVEKPEEAGYVVESVGEDSPGKKAPESDIPIEEPGAEESGVFEPDPEIVSDRGQVEHIQGTAQVPSPSGEDFFVPKQKRDPGTMSDYVPLSPPPMKETRKAPEGKVKSKDFTKPKKRRRNRADKTRTGKTQKPPPMAPEDFYKVRGADAGPASKKKKGGCVSKIIIIVVVLWVVGKIIGGLSDKDEKNVEVISERQTSPLIVSTVPPGADLYLDGERIGVSPYSGNAEEGSHLLVIKLSGYSDIEYKVEIAGDKGAALNFTMQPKVTGHSAKEYYEMAGKEKDIHKRIELYKKAIKADPQYAPAYNDLAVDLLELDRNQEAADYLLKAIEVKPDYALAYNNLGVAYRNMDQMDNAIEAYKKSINLNPKYANAHNNLGRAYFARERYVEALKAYKRASALDPKNDSYLFNVGRAQSQLGNHKASAAAYARCIKLNPENIDAYYNAGDSYQKAGDLKNAIKYFEMYIKKENRSSEQEWVERARSKIAEMKQ